MKKILCGLLGLLPFYVSNPVCAANILPVAHPRIVHVYPHDTHAFTEGLLFHDGMLYESTGFENRSFIRQEDVSTGKVIRSVALPSDLFGEGIVDWGDQLLSVTWRSQIGFRWNLSDLKRLSTLHYTGEGWALTQDGKHLILSDGTPYLRFLDPGDFHVVRRLLVTADDAPVRNLNELEYVHGEILANIWMTSEIARIDPNTGKVKGWIDITELTRRAGLSDPDSVANGIAYDSAGNRLFVTGKNWPSLFEIECPVSEVADVRQ